MVVVVAVMALIAIGAMLKRNQPPEGAAATLQVK